MSKWYYTRMRSMVSAALALAVALCLFAAPVFAADGVSTGTEAAPAKMAITKLLKMPVSAATPAATFSFDFEKVSVNGATSAAELAGMPTLTASLSYSSGDQNNVNPPAEGVKAIRMETPDVLSGVTWPHAGVYVYKIKEQQDSYTIADASKESMTYSAASYLVSIYVEDGQNKSYVSAISAIIENNDEANAASKVGDKVDATPGGSDGNGSSALVFTNIYRKTLRGTAPADSMFSVSKTTAGAYADKTKAFEYSISVDKAALDAADPTRYYTVYLLDENGAVLDPALAGMSGNDIGTDAQSKQFIKFTDAASYTVKLTHGQRLSFIDLPIGASYDVTETAASGYKPSYIITENDVAQDAVNGSENADLGTGKKYLADTDDFNKNSVDYTNTSTVIAPTGITIDDMPYIVLIALAALAAALYSVFRYRRRSQESR